MVYLLQLFIYFNYQERRMAESSRTPHGGPTGRQLLAVIGLWAVGSVAVGGATFALYRAWMPGADSGTPTAIVVAEVYAILLAAMALVFRSDFRAVAALERTKASEIARAGLACLAAYGVLAPIQALLAPDSWRAAVAILEAIGSDDGRLGSGGPVLMAVILLRACVLAPVGEELFFRGALFGWLRRRLSAPASIGLSAAAFASIHGFPPILPIAFALGVAWGWIRERSGSTIPTLVAHVIHNVVLVAIAYATSSWMARLPAWDSP
jgi:membrane protease YdiL (CAAX protease family)